MTRPDWASTITGRVDVTTLMRAGERQVVRTFLPAGYENTDRDYPVLYMFDGHNLFDRATSAFGSEWRIDETLTDMQARGQVEGVVVVGIDAAPDAAGRYSQYSAWDWTGPDGQPVAATGRTTADFLVETVMPYVNRTYRVRPGRAATALGGSSMGGYMTLFVGTRHTEHFGTLLSFSPAVLRTPMRADLLFDYMQHHPLAPGTRVYLDMGDAEELSYATSEALVACLWRTRDVVAGMGPAELVARVIPGAAHNEDSWAARFGEVICWAFAGGPPPNGGHSPG
jgi:enterochelin esterase-like enzyme